MSCKPTHGTPVINYHPTLHQGQPFFWRQASCGKLHWDLWRSRLWHCLSFSKQVTRWTWAVKSTAQKQFMHLKKPSQLRHLHLLLRRLLPPPRQPRLRLPANKPGSAGIAQSRCNPVYREVYAALRPFIGDAGAVAANQFHLQMVQRVNIGKTVLDGARQ